MEVPVSVAKAYFYSESTIAPMNGPISEVTTAAKKDLKPGDILDGIGGYTVYGLIEQYHIAKNENLVPLGLCENAKVKKAVKKDSLLTYDDLELNTDSVIYKLRKLQESLIY
jgi:predicted homoserine dehydrogenase-like protein